MIDVTQTVKNLVGKDFGEGDPDGPSTIRTLLVNVLAMCNPEEAIPAQEKYLRGKLAEKIHNEDTIEATKEEIEIAKRLIAKAYTNNVLVARIWDILDPPD
jgi:hypothetical protein